MLLLLLKNAYPWNIWKVGSNRAITKAITHKSKIEGLTFGGGRKLFLPTLIRWSTLASSCVLAVSLQYSLSPGRATSRSANSFWNMSTAQRNRGLCSNSLNTKGDEIWKIEMKFTSPFTKHNKTIHYHNTGKRINLIKLAIIDAIKVSEKIM